jgi:hypothetical protein
MAKKSNKKVVLKRVIIGRGGKRMEPPIGKAFEFTDEELENIERVNPGALRDAVNEDDEADTTDALVHRNSAGFKTPAAEGDAKTGADAAGKAAAADKGAAGGKATGKTDDDL